MHIFLKKPLVSDKSILYKLLVSEAGIENVFFNVIEYNLEQIESANNLYNILIAKNVEIHTSDI